MVFLQESHVLLETTQIIVLFGTKCLFLAHENPEWQAVFLSKTNSILKVKHVLHAPESNIDEFLSQIHVFLQLS
jgi:hypothetical protein